MTRKRPYLDIAPAAPTRPLPRSLPNPGGRGYRALVAALEARGYWDEHHKRRGMIDAQREHWQMRQAALEARRKKS